MKSRYQNISTMPRRLSSFQPFRCVANNRNSTVDSSDSVEYVSPFEMTLTCEPGLMIAVWMNHGSPRQISISNTFDPTALDTAMSP
uniref:Uncharacterized protein n=1 Tax=Anopheles dirus TaxID=7168 RepID=A0A182NWY4_9DIPT